MTSPPNTMAQTADFEFSALSEATNYRAALFTTSIRICKAMYLKWAQVLGK